MTPTSDVVVDDTLLAAAVALSGRRLAILTGAGVSTDSGIPDYRGEETRRRARNPIRFAEFTASSAARRRYWARAYLGWPRIFDAQTNLAHDITARLVQSGRASGCVTQNVDGLHGRAGAPADRLVELHGALARVRCLSCGRVDDRDALQRQLAQANPWLDSAHGQDRAAPDGDLDLDDDVIERFVVVDCPCGGPYKPAVTFFGENVEPAVLAHAWRVVDDAQALLVLGSSLEVFSGRRFVEAAVRRGVPVVLVTRGLTRADALVTVKIDAGVAPTLTRLFPGCA